MMAVTTTAEAKANTGTVKVPSHEMPNTIASAAPTPAPEVTPMIDGSASGLANTACMSVPATPRHAPTRKPSTIRGRRISHTTEAERSPPPGPSARKRTRSPGAT